LLELWHTEAVLLNYDKTKYNCLPETHLWLE